VVKISTETLTRR